MRINLVCPDNGWGLSRDKVILERALLDAGHALGLEPVRLHGSVHGPATGLDVADLNIFCEVVDPTLFRFAKHQVVIPNAEWTKNWQKHAPELHIWCKTEDAMAALGKLGGKSKGMRYLGFTSIDRQIKTLKEPEFLHLGGRSLFHQTDAVIEAWLRHPEWPMLHVTRDPDRPPKRIRLTPTPDNIALSVGIIADDVVTAIQNRCLFHIMPSAYEGFGHTLNEGLSCGAIVLTTAASPMSEIVPPDVGVPVPWSQVVTQQLVKGHFVDPVGIEVAVERALALTDAERSHKSECARTVFEDRDKLFRMQLARLCDEIEAEG